MTDSSDIITTTQNAELNAGLNVGLFTTCLVDTFKPAIAEATLEILKDAGCKVHMPLVQNCCALTEWNISDHDAAREMALSIIKQYATSDYVVVPSKSCAIMLRDHYKSLFQKDPTWKDDAFAFSSKVHEFSDFLKQVLHHDYTIEESGEVVISNDPAFILASRPGMKKSGDSRKVVHIAEALRVRKNQHPGQD